MTVPNISSLLVLVFFCYTVHAQKVKLPETFEAKITAVKDGDTMEALFEKKIITIRLAHIDCPEIKKGQPFGSAAKKYSSGLCFGETVTIENNNKYDRYKRLIAVVINAKGDTVNKELVKAGYAWHFKKYSTDPSYAKLEATARENKIGLWAVKDPTPPWLWRKPTK